MGTVSFQDLHSDLTMAAHWVGLEGGVHMSDGLDQELQEQTGMGLSPVVTETGQSTQELPCPRWSWACHSSYPPKWH